MSPTKSSLPDCLKHSVSKKMLGRINNPKTNIARSIYIQIACLAALSCVVRCRVPASVSLVSSDFRRCGTKAVSAIAPYTPRINSFIALQPPLRRQSSIWVRTFAKPWRCGTSRIAWRSPCLPSSLGSWDHLGAHQESLKSKRQQHNMGYNDLFGRKGFILVMSYTPVSTMIHMPLASSLC